MELTPPVVNLNQDEKLVITSIVRFSLWQLFRMIYFRNFVIKHTVVCQGKVPPHTSSFEAKAFTNKEIILEKHKQ